MADVNRLAVSAQRVADALRQDGQWRGAARSLGIAPGLAFMIRTGIPADGSGAPDLDAGLEERFKLADPQSLVNPAQHNPTRDAQVVEWVAARAKRDLAGAEGAQQDLEAAGSDAADRTER